MQPLGRDVQQIELAVAQRAWTRRASAPSSEELRTAARTPAGRSASTWSFISEMSGDTTMAMPGRTSAGSW